MAIGTKFVTKLTPEDGDNVRACLARLDEAASHLQGAAASLGRVNGFEREHNCLLASVRSIEHEKQMIQRRYVEITARAVRLGE